MGPDGPLAAFVYNSVNVGNALTLRKMLKDALGEVMGERMPMLQKTVDLARSQFPENTYHDPAYVEDPPPFPID
jgi:hypothetical protein